MKKLIVLWWENPGNGAPNWLDPDADGDGEADGDEGRDDTDGNGVPEYLDPADVVVVDVDADGIIDVEDNCPEDSNPGQLDLDGDGLGDVCDRDADGDGFADDLIVYGGGCACRGHAAPSALGGLVLLLLWRRRR